MLTSRLNLKTRPLQGLCQISRMWTMVRVSAVLLVLFIQNATGDSPAHLPTAGPELEALIRIGTRVIRGRDWQWGTQDGTPPGPGVVTTLNVPTKWHRVKWDAGGTNVYRVGLNGKYDLQLAEPPATTEPATTLPATTHPVTTLPATTLPATTLPATTLPATTLPATTLPVTTLPATTLPATTLPATTLPVTTLPVTTLPVTTLPVTTLPATTLPATTLPATTLPATTQPEVSDTEDNTVSELICGQSQIQIGLLLTALQSSGLNGSSGHLADPRCSSFTERDGTVWYQVERQADTCGNILTTNNTHAIYSNSLFVYPANNSLPVSFPFSCVYPLDTETSLDVAIRPNLQLEGGTSGVGSPTNTSMSLFQNSNYTEPYPAGPVTLPVGSALHVGVSVGETDPRFAVVLDDCYATHSSSPDDLMRHFLIQNKCSTNRRQVTVVESGSSLQARFSALLFLFHGDYRDIYLHCSLHLCDQRASSCSPVCSGRRRRSVSTSVPFKPITIGPITWDKLVE